MTIKTLTVLALTCLTLSACGGVDPNSPLGQRKAIFKQMLHTSEDMNGMLLGRLPFDGAQFAASAVKLDQLAQQPWQHFPKVREEDHTAAKADVWEKQARFQELARALEASTAQLVLATRAQPLEATGLDGPMQKVEGSCKACHREFRDH
ncbi:cytochrome c, class II [Pseudomonas sp. M47T1]|uniref:c-type cytochrome n=1 Tax=unclassified Pseudomonas TaxID=196821 RepID=UPI0002607CC6|nr:cytochrome c [Pseudomonas sp. M47T1]EIK98589.1 cytochrome c, class II [Pseudomonas sp. M47T1]